MKLRRILPFSLTILLASCAQTSLYDAEANRLESQRLNTWLDEKYEEQLEFSPISLTYEGSKKYYDEIDDMSPESMAEQLAWQQESLAELQASFSYELLDDEGKTSYDLWQYNVTESVDGWRFRDHGYLFHQMGGAHSNLPTFLIGFHPSDSQEDLNAYVTRIAGIGRAINQLTDRAAGATEIGVRPPRSSYETVLRESRELITGEPFQTSSTDSPIWADVQERATALREAGNLSTSQEEAMLYQARLNLVQVFEPAYERLIEFIEDDLENTSTRAMGVSALPDGIDFYDYMLRVRTTTDLSAAEIHQLGLQEVARLRQDMVAIKDATGFEGDLNAFFVFIRDSLEDERFYYPDTDEGRLAYINDATKAIETIKTQLPDYFGILPKADLVVKRVEAFREQPSAAQHYYAGTPDGTRPGTYYAHLSDMKAMPKNQLEVIACHEGLPGHHMQISIAQEQSELPKFRRQGFHTAYGEGWALYSELFAKEIPGTYQDLYSDFGRLSSEIWRAIRLVVDTGLHAMNWSEDEAIEYFSENSPEPTESIRSEVRRYLVLPGQATSYKIGMLKILELRAQSEAALGDNFDIRDFHDQILGGGSLPLALLEERIDRWIQREIDKG